MAGYTRQSSYSNADVIDAADSNNEYDALVGAFDRATGHKHDGTAAEGPVIGVLGDAGLALPLNNIVIDTGANSVGFFTNVSSVAVEQFNYTDGLIAPVITGDVDLGTNLLRFGTVYADVVNAPAIVSDSITVGTAPLSSDAVGNQWWGDTALDSLTSGNKTFDGIDRFVEHRLFVFGHLDVDDAFNAAFADHSRDTNIHAV